MVTWKVVPTFYEPWKYGHGLPCRVCSQTIFGKPYEALALCCSEGGREWAELKSKISLPVYCCSDLCASMFIMGAYE